MSQENVDRAVEAIRAFNRLASDIEALDQATLEQWVGAMDTEIQFEPQQAALQGAYVGREGALQWLADLADHYRSGYIEYSDVRDFGERVLCLGKIHVVGRGSGIEADVPASILMTFRDGLMTKLHDFGADTEHALEAAGLAE